MKTIEIIGQIVGVIAVVITFLSYQTNKAKKLLLVQTLATCAFSVHYLLIGATTGLAMNLVAILRNLVFYHQDKKFFSGSYWKWIFAVLMTVAGVLNWQGWYSIFIVLGIAINTLCLSSPSPQFVRKSILVTSPMVMTYDIFVLSFGGVVNEAVAIVSSIVGIVRYHKNAPKAEKQTVEVEKK